jgi:hypothetical protein
MVALALFNNYYYYEELAAAPIREPTPAVLSTEVLPICWEGTTSWMLANRTKVSSIPIPPPLVVVSLTSELNIKEWESLLAMLPSEFK